VTFDLALRVKLAMLVSRFCFALFMIIHKPKPFAVAAVVTNERDVSHVAKYSEELVHFKRLDRFRQPPDVQTSSRVCFVDGAAGTTASSRFCGVGLRVERKLLPFASRKVGAAA
jgi:hypothetical protein